MVDPTSLIWNVSKWSQITRHLYGSICKFIVFVHEPPYQNYNSVLQSHFLPWFFTHGLEWKDTYKPDQLDKATVASSLSNRSKDECVLSEITMALLDTFQP